MKVIKENAQNLMRARHSVRNYKNKPIEADAVEALNKAIEEINAESGLRFVLVCEEPEAFKANKPSYGQFTGCRNYIICFGAADAAEKVGYYGEKMVLLAQYLGLNTCWVALTFEKSKLTETAPEGMKLHDLIAIGYGETPGHNHKSKPAGKVAKLSDDDPDWYRKGIDAALNAPTAINQQRFKIERAGERGIKIKALLGPCSKTDLGIVKYHFELGAGVENFDWA